MLGFVVDVVGCSYGYVLFVYKLVVFDCSSVVFEWFEVIEVGDILVVVFDM